MLASLFKVSSIIEKKKETAFSHFHFPKKLTGKKKRKITGVGGGGRQWGNKATYVIP